MQKRDVNQLESENQTAAHNHEEDIHALHRNWWSH